MLTPIMHNPFFNILSMAYKASTPRINCLKEGSYLLSAAIQRVGLVRLAVQIHVKNNSERNIGDIEGYEETWPVGRCVLYVEH